ncbi:MAG: prephenate dehydratase domain-containing protein, partial [Verrucomicrobiota bacterium]
MNVGYLGRKPVTFGYEAATQMRGDSYVGFGTHGEIYESVREGIVDVGVLAVENQLAGEVDESLHAVVQPIVDEADRLEGTRTHVKIVQELTVPVRLFLMNQSGKEEDVELVMTHAVPMRQAKGALDRLRGERPIRLETCASTDAAAAVASQRSEVAAISSQLALDVYGLTSLGRVDDPVPGGQYHNVTRFWVIEKGDAAQWDEGTSLPGDEAVKV